MDGLGVGGQRLLVAVGVSGQDGGQGGAAALGQVPHRGGGGRRRKRQPRGHVGPLAGRAVGAQRQIRRLEAGRPLPPRLLDGPRRRRRQRRAPAVLFAVDPRRRRQRPGAVGGVPRRQRRRRRGRVVGRRLARVRRGRVHRLPGGRPAPLHRGLRDLGGRRGRARLALALGAVQQEAGDGLARDEGVLISHLRGVKDIVGSLQSCALAVFLNVSSHEK